MNLQFDISISTVIVSVVVGVVGWSLKAVAHAAIETFKEIAKKLLEKMVETIARVEVLDAKLDRLVDAVGDHEKLRSDINQYYRQLKDLRTEFEKRN